MTRTKVSSFANKLAPAYLTVLMLYQFLLYFMIGNIFHSLFLPMIDHTHFAIVWVTTIILIPFFAKECKNAWNEKRIAEQIFLVSCGVFVSIASLKRLGTVEAVWGLLTAITVFMFLLLAPKLLKKRHYAVLFWFVCILAGVHAVSQICFVLGQTQQFCGFNVNMPHGRLMRVPHLPLLSLLDGYTGGWFTNPNCLASYIMAIPAISIFLSQSATTRLKAARWLALSICGLTSISLLLTFSRAAILSTMLGMIPLAVYALRQRKVPVFASVSFLFVLVGVLFFAQMRFTTLGDPLSLSGRMDIWNSVSESLQRLPFFGYGTFRGTNTGETPHNVFLANLLFYGVPGLFSLLSMLGSGIYMIWRQVKREPNYGVLALFGFLLAYICAYSQIEFVFTCPHSFSNSVALLVFGFLIYLSTIKPKDIQTVRDNEAESEILTKAVANGLQKAVRT